MTKTILFNHCGTYPKVNPYPCYIFLYTEFYQTLYYFDTLANK